MKFKNPTLSMCLLMIDVYTRALQKFAGATSGQSKSTYFIHLHILGFNIRSTQRSDCLILLQDE